MIELIPTAIVALAAFFLLDRAERRAQAAIDILQAEHVAERRELLNRIQAPEVEIAKQFEPTSLDQSVGFDDDDAYWDAVKDRSEAWR